MLLPLLGRNLHLSLVTRAIDRVHFFLANKFLSRLFAVGVVNVLESIEGVLVAGLGRNLPVADSDFMIAKLVVFGQADVVARIYVSSQRAYLHYQNGPPLIGGYSHALVVAISNVNACFSRTEFDGADVAIECLQVIFGFSKSTIPVNAAHRCICNVVILQTPRSKPRKILIGAGRLWFATERTSQGKLLASALLLVLLTYGCFALLIACPANDVATA